MARLSSMIAAPIRPAAPALDVHISTMRARGEYHRHSKISSVATGVICGLGPIGYIAALHATANMK